MKKLIAVIIDDEEPVALADFMRDNHGDDDLPLWLETLRAGDELSVGGGAAPLTTIAPVFA